MRFQPVCLLLVLLLACLGCQVASPTATPVLIPMPTPTVQPTETSRHIAVISTTSSTPGVAYRTENVETFHGPAGPIIEDAKLLFAQGKHSEAITKYKEAQGMVDEPSQTIQSRIGLSYRYLRDNEQAIHHFSKAIEVNDTSADRVNRASVYAYNDQCHEAMQDARASLTMKPSTGVGFHTYVEAHLTLGQCLMLNEQYELALEQVDLALAIAKEYNFSHERIEQIVVFRADIESVAEGYVYPEDFLLGYASEDFEIGVAHFYGGRYPEAIVAFQSAKQHHGKPSGLILHMLARSYISTGDFDSGTYHFSGAIEVRDDAVNRVWRALHYSTIGDCDKGVDDAYAALSRKPYMEFGYHTTVEAFLIIADCQTFYGQFEGDPTDIEEARILARENGYTSEDIILISKLHQKALDRRKRQETPTP